MLSAAFKYWTCSVLPSRAGHAQCCLQERDMLSAASKNRTCSAAPEVAVLRPACGSVAGRQPGMAVNNEVLEVAAGADPGQAQLQRQAGRGDVLRTGLQCLDDRVQGGARQSLGQPYGGLLR